MVLAQLVRVLVVPVVVPKVLFLFVAGTLNRHPFIHCEQVIHAPSKGYKAKIPAPVEDARILIAARRGLSTTLSRVKYSSTKPSRDVRRGQATFGDGLPLFFY